MGEVYISVDVETSGPMPGAYSMLSIGACEVGQTEMNFYIELRPISERFVPEAIRVVGRPLSEFSKSGQDPRKAMTQFRDWICKTTGEHDPIFVGFNAAFDWSFVNWYFHTYLEENPFGYTSVDIKSYYMGRKGCSWADTKLNRIAIQLETKILHTHHALSDAIEQAQMFELIHNSAIR